MAQDPSAQVDQMIKDLGDWRGEMMSQLRRTITAADSSLKEEWKWSTAVYTMNGNVVALGSFKDSLKVNFFKGASLPDPNGLLNGGLDAKQSRSIDLVEGDSVDANALQELVRAGIAANRKS